MYRNALIILAITLVPAIASAQARGPWELELGGSGQNSSKFDGFTAAANGSLSYFLTDQFEIGVRQAVGYSDLGGTAWNGTTTVAADFNLPLGDQGQIMPFGGANIGYVYGDGVHDSWVGGPEAGIKFFVNSSTFIYASMSYEINFDKHNGSSDGQVLYGLGLGVRL